MIRSQSSRSLLDFTAEVEAVWPHLFRTDYLETEAKSKTFFQGKKYKYIGCCTLSTKCVIYCITKLFSGFLKAYQMVFAEFDPVYQRGQCHLCFQIINGQTRCGVINKEGDDRKVEWR